MISSVKVVLTNVLTSYNAQMDQSYYEVPVVFMVFVHPMPWQDAPCYLYLFILYFDLNKELPKYKHCTGMGCFD